MKITIAIDSFKGSLSSAEAAAAVKRGILRADDTVVCDTFPVADGGEGLIDALQSPDSQVITVPVHGPLFENRNAHYLRRGQTAVIEMAAASGLTFVPEPSRNPMETTSAGTGELMLHALEHGCTELLIGIGGSATNDGGIGMASALGFRFLDEKGKAVIPVGKNLSKIRKIDSTRATPLLKTAVIHAACDVDNPLCGVKGASAVYGPQKGATPAMIQELDKGLCNLAACSGRTAVAAEPGSGAAGGLGFALRVFCNAVLENGIELVLGAVGIEESLRTAQLVITGEGRIDSQTAYGKVPAGVATLAKKYHLPVVAFAGSIGEGTECLYGQGIDAIVCIIDAPMDLHDAMSHASELLESAAFRTYKLFMAAHLNEKK